MHICNLIIANKMHQGWDSVKPNQWQFLRIGGAKAGPEAGAA